MNRKGWALACWMVLGVEARVPAQGLRDVAPRVDLTQVSKRMAAAVRDLAEDVSGPHFPRILAPEIPGDCQELHRSAAAWIGSIPGTSDPHPLRRSYSSIDLAWHRIRGNLSVSGVANSEITETIRRVDQADAAIHQALNLNSVPADLEGTVSPPTGLNEIRRLAYAMAQRGEATAAMIQSVYGSNSLAADLISQAREVAQLGDAYSDLFNDPNHAVSLDRALRDYVPIYQKSVRLGLAINANQSTPAIQSTWLTYATALNLTRENLKTTSAAIHPIPSAPNAPMSSLAKQTSPQIQDWAENLVRHSEELSAHLPRDAQLRTDGLERFLQTERLRCDCRSFRDDVRQGLDLAKLAFQFRQIDTDWQRLDRRVNRNAASRTGPNLQRLREFSRSFELIHRDLGMLGYPPVIPPN